MNHFLVKKLLACALLFASQGLADLSTDFKEALTSLLSDPDAAAEVSRNYKGEISAEAVHETWVMATAQQAICEIASARAREVENCLGSVDIESMLDIDTLHSEDFFSPLFSALQKVLQDLQKHERGYSKYRKEIARIFSKSTFYKEPLKAIMEQSYLQGADKIENRQKAVFDSYRKIIDHTINYLSFFQTHQAELCRDKSGLCFNSALLVAQSYYLRLAVAKAQEEAEILCQEMEEFCQDESRDIFLKFFLALRKVTEESKHSKQLQKGKR